jgi:hypothetical protein
LDPRRDWLSADVEIGRFDVPDSKAGARRTALSSATKSFPEAS